MDPLAPLHPQVVHFAIALLFLGVPLRLLSLTGKVPFAKHAATTLLLLGTIAAVVSVKSGTAAHGPVSASRARATRWWRTRRRRSRRRTYS